MTTGTTDVPTGNTYDKYATTNPIEQRMMRGFLKTLDGMLDGLSPTRVLEVGVGEGEVMGRLRDRFPDATMIGLDLPDPELASDWRRADISCLFGDGTALPFPDDAFDLVLAIEVLEHVPGPDAALRELARVCSDRLITSVPFEPIWRAGNLLRRRYVRQWGNTPGHVNHWTRRGFGRFVAGSFDLEQVKSPLPWTMVRGMVRARVGA
jgi:SAM-dependent methyltransferase